MTHPKTEQELFEWYVEFQFIQNTDSSNSSKDANEKDKVLYEWAKDYAKKRGLVVLKGWKKYLFKDAK